MRPTPPQKTEPIIIVGAGVFGLSTALHLAQRGYNDVTVFDKQPYDKTHYSYFEGCDAASADINKIVRSAYGSQAIYQTLALESIGVWKAWNDELASGETVPPGMDTKDKLFINNGELSMSDDEILPQFERDTIKSMEQAGYEDSQLVAGNAKSENIAKEKGFSFAMDPFRRRARGKNYCGVVDTTGGVAVADKACRFALHEARSFGVRFILGRKAGTLKSLQYSDDGSKTVIGIETMDGRTHDAVMTIIACGGWTPAILPELDGLCEATAGSVAMFKIPNSSKLWDRLSPEKFPAWAWNMRKGADGGLYGFPRDDKGWFKIGYRGTKYTNPVEQEDGKERSTPVTRWSEGQKLGALPKKATQVINKFLDEYLPELGEEEIGMAMTRVCWYTDTFDNHLLIDRVPGYGNLMVATGGSGHAFKYLPCLGKWVVDIIEGIGSYRPEVKAWAWRKLKEGDEPHNSIMEGNRGSRAFRNVQMVDDHDLTGI